MPWGSCLLFVGKTVHRYTWVVTEYQMYECRNCLDGKTRGTQRLLSVKYLLGAKQN